MIFPTSTFPPYLQISINVTLWSLEIIFCDDICSPNSITLFEADSMSRTLSDFLMILEIKHTLYHQFIQQLKFIL